MKKILSLLLAFVFVIGICVSPMVITANAASYPLPIFDFSNPKTTNVIPAGEVGFVVFTIFREFNNEKFHMEIYNSKDERVAYCTTDVYGSSLVFEQTISINTKELEMGVGKYKIKYWMEFYSMYEWHTAPKSYTTHIEVIKNVCKGNHNMVFKETFMEGDCKTEGSDIYKCTKCQYYKYKNVPGSGHSFGSWSNLNETQHQRTCSKCSATETKNHTWNKGKITLLPTETTSGTKLYTCTKCSATFTETVYMCAENYHKYDNASDSTCNKCGCFRLVPPSITKIESTKDGVRFTWNAVEGVEGYIVFKLTQNEAGEYVYQKLAVVGPSTLAFTDWTAVDGETYCYAVASMDVNGDLSGYQEFSHTHKLLTLSTPKASVKSTSSGVKVSWKAIENAETYTVYRRTYNATTKKWGDWKKLKSGYTKTSFTDKKAKLGTKYRYTVKAINGDFKSKYKSTDTIKYNVTPTVKVAKVSNGVKVTWSTAANATSYKIYRSTYNTKTKEWGSWKGIKTAKATSKSYTDKTAKKGVKYRYTVRAVNGSYKSTFKASGSVKR